MARVSHAGVFAAAAGAVLLARAVPLAQEPFLFVMSVVDESGRPVRDLKRDEIVVTENGVAAEITKVEPVEVPVQLTVAVDNGPLSVDALAHYRTGRPDWCGRCRAISR